MTNEAPASTKIDGYHWGWVTYFSVIHVVALGALLYVPFAAWQTIVFAIVYYFLCHLSITIGAHRLYAHRSFRVVPWLHYLLVLLFSGVMQGPITWWAGKHRLHHEKSDVAGEDPHTPQDGFWHAHMLWLVKRRGLLGPPDKHVLAFRKPAFAPGRLQARYYLQLGIIMAFVLPTLCGALWGDALGGLLIGGFLRLFFQYHFTWVVNSVGHTWGEHVGGSATNQRGPLGSILAVLTVGESNHGAHHQHAGSYRIGRDPGQVDPGAWILERMAALGVVTDLKDR